MTFLSRNVKKKKHLIVYHYLVKFGKPTPDIQTCLSSPSADYAPWSYLGGCHSIHSSARDGSRPSAERGAGIRHPRAEYPVSKTGHQLPKGPRAAPQAG